MSTQKIQWVFNNRNLGVKTTYNTQDEAVGCAINHLIRQQLLTKSSLKSSTKIKGDRYTFELTFPDSEIFVYEVYPEAVKLYRLMNKAEGKNLLVTDSLDKAISEAKRLVDLAITNSDDYSLDYHSYLNDPVIDRNGRKVYVTWDFDRLLHKGKGLSVAPYYVIEDVDIE